MTEFKGGSVELIVLFLEGKEIEYKRNDQTSWGAIPSYNGEASDIYRVSNPNYLFRKKAEVKKAYMFFDDIERVFREEDFNLRNVSQALYDKPLTYCDHFEFTFVDNKLTNVEIKRV